MCVCVGGRGAVKMKLVPRSTRGSKGHHTEHLSTGFIGEPFGQWKTRANSSNWETLPITLQGEDTQERGDHETFVYLCNIFFATACSYVKIIKCNVH